MALDKTFAAGEILSAGDVNGHLLGLWIPIDKRVITSGSPVASVSFQSIDSNFRIFRLTYYLTPTGSGSIDIRLNNDSATNYDYQQDWGAGGTPSSSRAVGATGFLGQWQSPQPMLVNFLIAKPTTTTPGRLTGHVVFDNTSTIRAGVIGGIWNNTSALINRIDLVMSSNSMHGIVALEGVRGA